MTFDVRPLTDADREHLRTRAVELWGSEHVIVAGREHVPHRLAGLAAVEGGQVVGFATWASAGNEAELVTLDAVRSGRGVGTALLAAARSAVRDEGARTLRVVTTNDNLDALRFYQRRGFRIAAVRPGAVDESRKGKPEIPETGDHGIPIRDEIELVTGL